MVSVKDDPELNVESLENTFATLAPRADGLIQRFYSEFFHRYHVVQPMSANTDLKKQCAILVAVLHCVASNLRNPNALEEKPKEIGARHEEYGAKPGRYNAVSKTLLDVMGEFSGPAWTRQAQWPGQTQLVGSQRWS